MFVLSALAIGCGMSEVSRPCRPAADAALELRGALLHEDPNGVIVAAGVEMQPLVEFAPGELDAFVVQQVRTGRDRREPRLGIRLSATGANKLARLESEMSTTGDFWMLGYQLHRGDQVLDLGVGLYADQDQTITFTRVSELELVLPFCAGELAAQQGAAAGERGTRLKSAANSRTREGGLCSLAAGAMLRAMAKRALSAERLIRWAAARLQ